MKKPISVAALVSSFLELPKEVTLNLPVISIIGGEDVLIENYKAVSEYSRDTVKVAAKNKTVKICGVGLRIKEISPDSLTISGQLETISFF